MKHILAIEDEPPTIVGSLAELEEQFDVRISSVRSVEEAGALLSDHPYDLLIIDWRLPIKMDTEPTIDAGDLFLKWLRAGKFGEKNIATPYIVATVLGAQVDLSYLNDDPLHLGTVAKLELSDLLLPLFESGPLRDSVETKE